MKRRRFIQAATSSLLLPATLAAPWVPPLATDAQVRGHDFFDDRFEHARRVAAAWSAANRPTAVQGDITPWWRGGLDRATREHALTLRGVTTESFHFCLRILAGEHANLDTQVSRLDRNLLLWTMRTTPKLTTGRLHG